MRSFYLTGVFVMTDRCCRCKFLWMDLLQMHRVLWLVFGKDYQTKWDWEAIVAYECSKVFLANRWRVFRSQDKWCSCLFFPLNITHNAQPHKLTDGRMGHGVIRLGGIAQYRRSSSDLMLLPSAHVLVIDTTPMCWYLTPTPSVSVCHIRFASGTHSATASRCL